MNKTISTCSLICATAVGLVLSVVKPWILGDNNTFLKSFVNSELLGFLGVVVTITLASAANLHLELHKCEEEIGEKIFFRSKSSAKRSAYWLITLLFVALILVMVKPLAAKHNEIAASLFNTGAILIVLANIFILIDLTQAAFTLHSRMGEVKKTAKNPK